MEKRDPIPQGRDTQLIEAIILFTEEHRYPPSETELAEIMKVHRSAINKWLKEMESRGIIERPGRGRRTVRVLQRNLDFADNT